MGIGLLTFYLCALGSAFAIKVAAVPVRCLRLFALYLIDLCRLRLALHPSVRASDHMTLHIRLTLSQLHNP
jgi:hypothetical protein